MIKLILFVMLFSPINAYAYLDPGTGSLIIQGLIAFLASVVAAWGFLKAKIKSMFIGDQHNSDPLSDENLEKAIQEKNKKEVDISKHE